MSPFWNTTPFANNYPKPFTYSLPKPNAFVAQQNSLENRSAKSPQNILDLTHAWREEVRRASQRPDDLVLADNRLGSSNPIRPLQTSFLESPRLPSTFPQSPPLQSSFLQSPPLPPALLQSPPLPSTFLQSPRLYCPPALAQPTPVLGFHTERSWLDESSDLSSSPVSDLSSARTVLAPQSPSSYSTVADVEPQTKPSFPGWSLNAAAADFVPSNKNRFLGEHSSSFSPERPGVFFGRSSSYIDPVHPGEPVYGAGHQHFGSNTSPQTFAGPHLPPPTFTNTVNIPDNRYVGPSRAALAPIATGLPPHVRNHAPRMLTPPTLLQQPPTQHFHKPDIHPRHSFFPIFPPAPVPSHTAAERGPSPFNRKTELYKTEICRNWEEKGFCYYRE